MYLFVYGLLTQDYVREFVFGRKDIIIKPAKVEGLKIGNLKTSGYNTSLLTVIPSDDDTAEGLLLEITDEELSRSDEFESYPYLYYRIKVNATTEEGDVIAWVYLGSYLLKHKL